MTEQKEMKVTLVQPNVVWEDKQANLARYEELLESAQASDLIVLPEMFSTGFSMDPEELSERMDGESVAWMRKTAKEKDACITGSLIIEENGTYFNRLIWMRPNGTYELYDKRHLFSFANEEAHYSAGNDRLIVEWNGWRICPVVCYDLRFPVWLRNQRLDGTNTDSEYDLLVVVANWPEARNRPWTNLLEARAHENQAFVIGVNRVGVDGNGISHSGDSAVFSPKGEPLLTFEPGVEAIHSVTLSLEQLVSFKAKFGAWRDKDQFRLER